MPVNTSFLPLLNGKHATKYPIKQAPERGKGIVYSIEWGFRINKSNSYDLTGEYVGLTSNSAAERFFSHMQAAKKLKYGYGMVDGRKSSIISGDTKEEDDTRMPKLFYIPFRTAMGETGRNIRPNETYKYLSVIEHVNLFDLAYTESKYISKRGTLSFSAGAYSSYAEFVRRASGSGRIGFNSTSGGEGNKINKGGMGSSELTHRELIMAAFYFIIDGRGARELRSNIGIKGSSLEEDIARVFMYFKNKASGFERMGSQAISKVSYLVKNDGTHSKHLTRIIQELGIKYFKTTSGGKISEKERLINTVIKYGMGVGDQMSLSRWDIQNFINAADKINGYIDKTRGIDLKVFGVDDPRQRKKIIQNIKSQQFMIKSLGVAAGLGILTKEIQRATQDPGFTLGRKVWNIAYSNLDAAIKQFLTEHPEMAGLVEKHKEKMSERAKRNQKYAAWEQGFD